MPFTLQSSGDKKSVISQVNGQITASYDQAPKDQDREDTKKRMEAIRDYLFNDLGGDFPDESPVGLVLVGDAGKNYVSITDLRFSISMPPKEADTEANPVPEKGTTVEAKTMNPPAPDKKPVGESTTPETAKAPVNPDATTASPNFTGTTPLNPTTTGKF